MTSERDAVAGGRPRRAGRAWAATLAVLVVAAAVVLAAAVARDHDDGGGRDGSGLGNVAFGRFHPPPIASSFPAGVRSACAVSSPVLDRIRRAGVLFWGIGISPPFGFEVGTGQWGGVEAQNAAELATLLGVRLDVAEYSYDVLPEVLVTGQADIVGAELFVTSERRRLIDFSRPYYQSGQLFYVLARSRYRTISDLDRPGVRFIYGTGTAQLDLARKYIAKATASDTPLGHRLLLHDALAAGHADATMSQAAALKVIRETYSDPALAAIGRRGRVTADRATRADMLDPFDVAFGVPKGDARWRRCVDAWAADLVRSGRMARRLDYWLAQPVA
jgi:ABC-type amino acid transport substrate-binding protein